MSGWFRSMPCCWQAARKVEKVSYSLKSDSSLGGSCSGPFSSQYKSGPCIDCSTALMLPPPPPAAGAAAAAAGAAAAAAAGAAPPPPRLARYSANDSALWMACCLPAGRFQEGSRKGLGKALWMACCLPLGSFGSYTVGAGSRVASPPPKPFPSCGAAAAAGGGGAGAACGGAAAGAAPPPPPARLARYSAKLSALWIACCLPLGSFGS